MRTFTLTDDKSNKFWNIELQGNKFTVQFGKIGTNGQTQVKEFADEAAAKKEYDKLVTEKTKKGYVETSSSAAASAPAKGGKAKAEPAPAPAASAPAAAPAAAGGRRTFTLTDDKSNKFWNIELQGKSFTVNYGRIGSSGQTQVKDFDDEAKAKKEHDKLVTEKTKKGYVETTPK
jgi:predicted DNA-binding WGR domain protein